MIQIINMKSFFLAAALLAGALSPEARAALVTVPTWDGDAQTTSASYTFTTSSPTAPPEAARSPYGDHALQVTVGPFGTGWQDPAGEFQLTRNGHGAWDLGRSGTLTVTVPIDQDGVFSLKNAEVFVEFVWYQSPTSIPGYGIVGLTPTYSSAQQELSALDNAGSWQRTVWEATYENLTTNNLILEFQAPLNGSVISSMQIYTRFEVVPEPAAITLSGLTLVAVVSHRRRF